jgi:hypothetical protein
MSNVKLDLLSLYEDFDDWTSAGCFSSRQLNKEYFSYDDEKEISTFTCPYCPDISYELDESLEDSEFRRQKATILRHLLTLSHRFAEYELKYPKIFASKSKMEVLELNKTIIVNEDGVFSCDICDCEPFATEKLLIQHLKSKSHILEMIEKSGEIRLHVKSRDTFLKVPTTTADEDDEIASYHTYENYYDNAEEKGKRKKCREIYSCSVCNKNVSKHLEKKFKTKEEMAIHIKTAYHKKCLYLSENPSHGHYWGLPYASWTNTTLECKVCDWKKKNGKPKEATEHYTSAEHIENVMKLCSKIE